MKITNGNLGWSPLFNILCMIFRVKFFPAHLIFILFCMIYTVAAQEAVNPDTISFRIDLNLETGDMNPVWAWFGYDEPNYTYMKDGRRLLTELSKLSPVPVYIRTHNLLTTGDGKAALKWGSTNAYTEDRRGRPVYNWDIVDSIIDSYVHRGMKPFVEIGFMPEALSIKPDPYRHNWRPGDNYNDIYTGWAYPPNDYEKWAELVFQWVTHSVERYGKSEVETWYWELWNEPNIPYWQGEREEFLKLYDYTADAVKRALPSAIVGGPNITGPAGKEAADFMREFIEHCLNGKNYATGKTGSPLELIAFHAKGNPRLVDSIVQMGMGQQLRHVSSGFEIVASYPELKGIPIIIGESDPEGCAACPMEKYPQFNYRNGTMYPAYTAASFARKYELADHFGVNFIGAVTWAFEFENQPWFAGFRDLATNGVNKPALNVFRMFGLMEGKRVEVTGDLAYDLFTIRDMSVRGKTDVGALASKGDGNAAAMVWNYHDLDVTEVPEEKVELTFIGIPSEKVLMRHYRIDHEYSNSYSHWLEMGSPQNPSPEQYAELERSGQLQMIGSPEWVNAIQGEVKINVILPRQAVSLIKFTWQ